MLDTASDLHVLTASHHAHGTIVDCLKTRRTVAIQRDPAGLNGDIGHQRRDACDVKTLFPLLLDAAPANVLDQVSIDLRAINECSHQTGGEFVSPNVTKGSVDRMSFGDGSPDGIDDDSTPHNGSS